MKHTLPAALLAIPNAEAQHADMVARLVKSPELLQEQSTPEKWGLLHAALGLAGEIGELLHPVDDAEFLEESGDIHFFFRDLRVRWQLEPFTDDPLEVKLRKLNGKRRELPRYQQEALEVAQAMPIASLDLAAVSWSGHIVDMTKKVVIYGQELDEPKRERVRFFLDLLEAYCSVLLDSYGLNREIALQANLWKLVKGPDARYPDGTYSDAEAEARADKKISPADVEGLGGSGG